MNSNETIPAPQKREKWTWRDIVSIGFLLAIVLLLVFDWQGVVYWYHLFATDY